MPFRLATRHPENPVENPGFSAGFRGVASRAPAPYKARSWPVCPAFACALRLSVRTPDFHSGKRGSTPLGRTTSPAGRAFGSVISEIGLAARQEVALALRLAAFAGVRGGHAAGRVGTVHRHTAAGALRGRGCCRSRFVRGRCANRGPRPAARRLAGPIRSASASGSRARQRRRGACCRQGRNGTAGRARPVRRPVLPEAPPSVPL